MEKMAFKPGLWTEKEEWWTVNMVLFILPVAIHLLLSLILCCKISCFFLLYASFCSAIHTWYNKISVIYYERLPVNSSHGQLIKMVISSYGQLVTSHKSTNSQTVTALIAIIWKSATCHYVIIQFITQWPKCTVNLSQKNPCNKLTNLIGTLMNTVSYLTSA